MSVGDRWWDILHVLAHLITEDDLLGQRTPLVMGLVVQRLHASGHRYIHHFPRTGSVRSIEVLAKPIRFRATLRAHVCARAMSERCV